MGQTTAPKTGKIRRLARAETSEMKRPWEPVPRETCTGADGLLDVQRRQAGEIKTPGGPSYQSP